MTIRFIKRALWRVSTAAGVTLATLWIIIGIVTVGIAIQSLRAINDAHAQMEVRATTFAHLIASHTNYQILRADNLLVEMLDHLTYADLNTDVSPSRRSEIERTLFAHRDRLPGIASFSLIGADGIRRYGVVNRNYTDLSKRGYFISLKEGGADTYVSPAEEGLASGKRGIHVARRLVTPNGEFGGVLVINLAVGSIFEPFFSSLNLGQDSIISLRESNRLLLRHPPAKDNQVDIAALGSGAIGTAMAKLPDRGIANSISVIDGIQRLSAYERIPDTPIYALVGLSHEVVVGEAIRDAWYGAGAALLAILGAIFGTITLRRLEKSRDVIRDMAYQDKLTGLPNRAYLVDAFDEIKKTAGLNGQAVSLIFLDLDNFKEVNDTLGHSAGDKVLIEVATVFRRVVPATDVVARLGGDEFIIAHRAKAQDIKESTEKLCWSIMDALRTPLVIDGQRILSGACLGATIAELGDEFDEMLRRSDVAMYRGKSFGKGIYTMYFPGLEDVSSEARLAINADLSDALDAQQLDLHYGPVVNLERKHVDSVEATLRWKRDDGKVVPADQILFDAEQTGLIKPIGNWMLDKCCAAVASWTGGGMHSLRVMLPVSPLQLYQADYAGVVLDTLAQHGVAPGALELQVKAAVLSAGENGAVRKNIAVLSDAGVRFCLVGFGSEVIPLDTLSSFPIHSVRIDCSLLKSAIVDKRKSKLLAAAVSLATSLGLETTVELVDSIDALTVVRPLNCTRIQGSLISQPLSRIGLMDFVRDFQMAPNT